MQATHQRGLCTNCKVPCEQTKDSHMLCETCLPIMQETWRVEGSQIRTKREQLGLSVQEFAANISLIPSIVVEAEAGKRGVSPQAWQRIQTLETPMRSTS